MDGAPTSNGDAGGRAPAIEYHLRTIRDGRLRGMYVAGHLPGSQVVLDAQLEPGPYSRAEIHRWTANAKAEIAARLRAID